MDPNDLPADPRQVVERLERRISGSEQPADAEAAVGEPAPLDAPAGDGSPSVPGSPEPPD
jgi:hypothetical protein